MNVSQPKAWHQDRFMMFLILATGLHAVILLGAIGGMMLSGIVGLFIGAVVLALGYELTLAWLGTETENEGGTPEPEPEAAPA